MKTLLTPEFPHSSRPQQSGTPQPFYRGFVVGAGVLALLLAVLLFVLLRESPDEEVRSVRAFSAVVSLDIARPVPAYSDADPEKVRLGRQLFHDVRLSVDDTVSCATCHSLNTGGVDNRVHSVGVQGQLGNINAPTVYNSGLNFVQFWDGRARTLEAQIEGPLNDPKEMGANWTLVLHKLRQDPSYPRWFSQLYAQGITADNVKDAIATFERSLHTPGSSFDQFLAGDAGAFTEQEQRGYELFLSYGCASCHQGVNLGGNMYGKMGLIGDYFADRGNITEADYGRYQRTRNLDHLYQFRVPPLRNVARTMPYFHDGSANTLEQAISVMGKYQLGRSMPEEDMAALVAFLRSLTGTYNGSPL
ncbi:cytochrome-c peroxidase [Candidatus Symbiobacter mobilis]|uniref:Cytochrome c peroxidase n=1 Tax=Candidatus Symbiobacter mobilis CR TaxID=946483 RepID=U5NCK4_9BURK|nr:cytochrome-c peroxidase [Candidatus Symbiobacter mobilis]AGX87879.1 cytochrome c peroxidase [Candidatus Symbiobacter mobilis CR]